MSDFFNMDNAFFRIMSKVAYVYYLNILWVLCSIPLVTIGASTTALASVTLELVRDEEGSVTKKFFSAFVKNFWQATVEWVLFLIVAIVLAGDVLFLLRLDSWFGLICAGICACLLMIEALVLTMVFNIQARFQNPIKATIKLAFIMALGYLPYSASLLIMLGCMLYGVYTSAELMIIFTFLGVAGYEFVSAYLLRCVFDHTNVKEEF